MKKIALFFAVLCIMAGQVSYSQAGRFLKNVKNAVQQEILGTIGKDKPETAPEPPSACEEAEMIFEIGEKTIDFSELNAAVLNDGRILLYDRMTDNYYISKGGVTEGPMRENDQRVKQFKDLVYYSEEDLKPEEKYIEYIKRQGDKYVIQFDGNTYGPYSGINSFTITIGRNKFAAVVVENIPVTEQEGKTMEAAIEKAKTDQEKMQLAMQYSQMMQERITARGGVESMMPKLVTNVPGASLSDAALLTSVLIPDMKYNEILAVNGNTVSDLTGRQLINLDYGAFSTGNTFISSDNRHYASYNYGTLTISDGRKIQELFNPHLLPEGGKVYLAYMYFSPKRNAIMRCRIPF